MFMRYTNRVIYLVSAVVLLLGSKAIDASKQEASGRTPVYPVAYELPTTDGIYNILNTIRGYYKSTSIQKIVDMETSKEITDFSIDNEHARVSPGFSSDWSYTHGVVLSAFEYIYKTTGDKYFLNDNVAFYNFVVKTLPYFKRSIPAGEPANGWNSIINTHALDDCGSISAALIKTFQHNQNQLYLPLINATAEYITLKQLRLEDGTLARHRPQYESVWADDMYMSVPFLANMGVLSGNTRYFDDAIKQVLQMADRLYIPEIGLFDHGWSVTSGDYDPHFHWARANGWVMMSMVELLAVLPEQYPGRDKVMHIYRSMVRSLASFQDGTGFWHNMIDKNNTFLETSASAMFTFAIAKGINEGWINHVYGPVAITGWNAIATRVQANGAVEGTVEATTFAHDNTYYFNRGASSQATHGYGPVLYAGIEIIRLLKNETLDIQVPEKNAINSTIHFRLKSEWPTE